MTEFTAAHKDKLLAEMRLMVADAEELLRATVHDSSDQAVELRGRIQTRLNDARERIGHLQETVVARARETGQATEAFVKDHPWQSVGVVAGAALLVGILIGRR